MINRLLAALLCAAFLISFSPVAHAAEGNMDGDGGDMGIGIVNFGDSVIPPVTDAWDYEDLGEIIVLFSFLELVVRPFRRIENIGYAVE